MKTGPVLLWYLSLTVLEPCSPLRLPVAEPWLVHLSGVGWDPLQGGLQEMLADRILQGVLAFAA